MDCFSYSRINSSASCSLLSRVVIEVTSFEMLNILYNSPFWSYTGVLVTRSRCPVFVSCTRVLGVPLSSTSLVTDLERMPFFSRSRTFVPMASSRFNPNCSSIAELVLIKTPFLFDTVSKSKMLSNMNSSSRYSFLHLTISFSIFSKSASVQSFIRSVIP